MKRIHSILSLMTVLAVACQTNGTSVPAPTETELVFKACYAEEQVPDGPTRTALQEDGSICWNAGEVINLFYGNACSAPFVSTNAEPGREVEFRGSLSDFHYNGTDSFWAVYPYNEANT